MKLASIRARLVLRLALVQLGLLLVLVVLTTAFARFGGDPQEAAAWAKAIRVEQIVSLDEQGRPRADRVELEAMKSDDPDFWVFAAGPGGFFEVGAPEVAIERARDLAAQVRSARALFVAPARGYGPFQLSVEPNGLVLAVAAGRLRFSDKAVYLADVLISNVVSVALLPIVAAFAAAALVSRDVGRALNPLQRAVAGASDDPGKDVDASLAPLEARNLAHTFRGLLQRRGRTAMRQQRFLADVAHELRTPLAIMRMRLDSLPAGQTRVRLVLDVDRLSGRIEALLAMARLRDDLGATTPVDLTAMARDLVIDRAPRAVEAGCDLALEAQGPSIVLSHPGVVEIVLANLIDNALAHAGAGSSIVVRVSGQGVVEVVDDGRGIAPDQRDAVLQPFVRASEGGQLGLGLALVKEAVEVLSGHLDLFETPGGGTTIRVDLSEARSSAG